MNKNRHWYVIKRTLPYLTSDRNLKLRLFISIFFVLLTISANLCLPFLLKNIIQILEQNKIQTSILTVVIFASYGFAWTLSRLFSQLRELSVYPVFQKAIVKLCSDLFFALNRFSGSFHSDKKTGEIINMVDRAQVAVPDAYWGLFFLIIPVSFEIIISSTIVAYLYSWVMSCIMLLFMCIYYLSMLFITQLTVKTQRNGNETSRKTSDYLLNVLLNYETIRYFSNTKIDEYHCQKVLGAHASALSKHLIMLDRVAMLQIVIIGLFLTLMTAVVGVFVIKGRMNISDFVLINSYILQFVSPLTSFALVLRQMRQGLTDLEDIVDLLDKKPDVLEKKNALPLRIKDAVIEFDNVWFSYNERTSILKGVSFTVPSHKTVAIVGGTGSGKSTLIKLLLRLYNPTSGRIIIDNQNINSVLSSSLYAAFGVVPQDVLLFNETLRYNIMYSNPNATDDELMTCIKKSKLDILLSQHAHRLDTVVGERGAKLSGGEKQRVAIARALLKKPEIFIFDEATSSLDSKTESNIMYEFNQITRDKTVIIISHRLSTIMNADLILVLNVGVIEEQGSHHELLQIDGLYRSLWQKQKIQPMELINNNPVPTEI